MSRLGEQTDIKTDWICATCNLPLVTGKVDIKYMRTMFNPLLPHCAKCGAVLIEEEIAVGKMLEVEKLLEDK